MSREGFPTRQAIGTPADAQAPVGVLMAFAVYCLDEVPLKCSDRFNEVYSWSVDFAKRSLHPVFVVDCRTNTTVIELKGGRCGR